MATTLITTGTTFSYTLDDLINANARAVAEAAEKQRQVEQARADEHQAILTAKRVKLEDETRQRFRNDAGINLIAALDYTCHAEVPDDDDGLDSYWVNVFYRDQIISLYPRRHRWEIKLWGHALADVHNVDLPSALLTLLGSIRDGHIQSPPPAEDPVVNQPATPSDTPGDPEPAPPNPDHVFLAALDTWMAHRYGLRPLNHEDDILF